MDNHSKRPLVGRFAICHFCLPLYVWSGL
ncbi:hypothetical protein EMIT0373P_40644 [Pseudomonas chlororaphis]